jgi:hypothetical protein
LQLCVLAGILMLSVSLTGCASAYSVPKELPSLYQPPVLRLLPHQLLQTQDGPYYPPMAEIWHSDARYQKLEQENINLAAALAQLRARP